MIPLTDTCHVSVVWGIIFFLCLYQASKLSGHVSVRGIIFFVCLYQTSKLSGHVSVLRGIIFILCLYQASKENDTP
jgi:uncharacterized membrane protein YiaA